MGCTPSLPTQARASEFAHAAACLASEIVLTIQGLDHTTPPTPAASKALAQASEAAHRLEELANKGESLDEAYRQAAWALSSAAVALGEMRTKLRRPQPVRNLQRHWTPTRLQDNEPGLPRSRRIGPS